MVWIEHVWTLAGVGRQQIPLQTAKVTLSQSTASTRSKLRTHLPTEQACLTATRTVG